MSERNIGDVILKVDNISLSFGVMKVLDDISFDVRQGEIRSIIGPNGAGKSSMLNVHQRLLSSAAGHRLPSRARPASRWRRTRRKPGHRAHLPEHRAVQGHEHARQHHDRAQPEDEDQPVLAGPAHRSGARARNWKIARRRNDHRLSRDPGDPQKTGRANCPTACKNASNSAAHSPPSRNCCCSTSPWRG